MNHMNTIHCIPTASHIVSFVGRAMVSYVVINLGCSSKEIFRQRPFHFSLSAMYHRPACNKVSASAHNSLPSSAKGFCCIPNGSFRGISVRSDRTRVSRMSSRTETIRRLAPPPRRPRPRPRPRRPDPAAECRPLYRQFGAHTYLHT